MTRAEWKALKKEFAPSWETIEEEQNILTPERRAQLSPTISPLALKCLMNEAARITDKVRKTRGNQGKRHDTV